MRLRNDFPLKVRCMYFDNWTCSLCGRNGQTMGGLELHHIKGRESSSALNSSLVCVQCHSHLGHNMEEEKKLMLKTLRFLVRNNYDFSANDLAFYNKYKKIYDNA